MPGPGNSVCMIGNLKFDDQIREFCLHVASEPGMLTSCGAENSCGDRRVVHASRHMY